MEHCKKIYIWFDLLISVIIGAIAGFLFLTHFLYPYTVFLISVVFAVIVLILLCLSTLINRRLTLHAIISMHIIPLIIGTIGLLFFGIMNLASANTHYYADAIYFGLNIAFFALTLIEIVKIIVMVFKPRRINAEE